MKNLVLLLSTLIPLSASVVLDDFTRGAGGVISLSRCGIPHADPFMSSQTGDTILGGSGTRTFRIYDGDCFDPNSNSTLTAEVDHGLRVTLGAGQRVDFNLFVTGQPYTITADDRYLVYEVAEAEGVSSVMYIGLYLGGIGNRVTSFHYPFPIPQGPGRYYFDLANASTAVGPGTVFDSYELIVLPLGPLNGTQDVRLTISRFEIVSVPEPALAMPLAALLACAVLATHRRLPPVD